jgi:hypothetical protein
MSKPATVLFTPEVLPGLCIYRVFTHHCLRYLLLELRTMIEIGISVVYSGKMVFDSLVTF